MSAAVVMPIEREVIRCGHCKLQQYRTAADVCRRCKVSTAPPADLEPEQEPVTPASVQVPETCDPLALAVGRTIAARRKQLGITQRDLAGRMKVVRTYISKVENSRTMPAIENLERFARALRMPLYRLMYDVDCRRLMLELARSYATKDVPIEVSAHIERAS